MKRFYDRVAVRAEEDGAGGFVILLDGKPVRTPGRALLVAPGSALAEAIAAEWRAQGEKIDPAAMPLTGFANRAVDLNEEGAGLLRVEIAGYAETDLLRHRADGAHEPALTARQAAVWDPWLDWAAEALDLRLAPVAGLMPARDANAIERARMIVAGLDPFQLPALHRATALLGSFVLGQALLRGAGETDALFDAAHVDEAAQAERWGRDAEAEARASARRNELHACARFLHGARAG